MLQIGKVREGRGLPAPVASSGGVRNLGRHGPGSREQTTTHIVVNKVEALSDTELESASTLCATVWGTLYLRWRAPKVIGWEA